MSRSDWPVWPAVIVTSPFAAYSLQSDERRTIFRNAARFDANPLPAAQQAWQEIGAFLERGNFRPVGRFIESVHLTLEFEVAEATALPPDVVHGLVRLLMVGALAVTVASLVRTVIRSAGGDGNDPLVLWAPMVTAGVLVAGGRVSAITAYPFALLGSAVLCVGVPQLVARGRDMSPRRLSVAEQAGLLVTGAVLAMIYDLVYITPLLCVALVASRAAASGLVAKEALRTAALRRAVVVLVGFAAVFVPIRIHLYMTCSDGGCYDASDVAINSTAIGLIPDRVLTGSPIAGWEYLFGASPIPNSISNWSLIGNGFMLLALAAVAAFGLRACTASLRSPGRVDARRVALALTVFAVPLALSASVLVSFSRWLQGRNFAVGRGWRETPLVQVAWGLMLLALIALLVELAGDTRRRAVFAAIALASVLMTSTTLVANARLTQIDRGDETAAILSEIATTSVYNDPSDAGNQRWCLLISQFVERYPNPDAFQAGPQLSQELDRFSLQRYGYPYCDESRR